MIDLIDAIVSHAKSDASLMTAVSNRFYYGEAQTDTMPYVVFSLIGGSQQKTFDSDACWTDQMVQFSIYDKSRGVGTVEDIYEKLVAALDRAELTLANSHKQIGCQLESSNGPIREEDCWHKTCDFLIGFA